MRVALKAVVSSEHPLASEMGVRVLKKGGNAIDAAVSTALTMGIVLPAFSGIGGGGFALVYLRREGKAFMLDFRERAPSKATSDMFQLEPDGKVKGDENKLGHSAVCVPGDVVGLCRLVEDYGRLSLKEVFEPVAEIAEGGFPVSRFLSWLMSTPEASLRLNNFPEIGRIFLKDGRIPEAGETLVLKELAETYRKIARHGPEVFYEGEIASAILGHLSENSGLLTEEDFVSYGPKLRNVVAGSYRGYEILTASPPSAGGSQLIQILNVLEEYDPKGLGRNSSELVHMMCEAMKLSFANRDELYGDPDFVDVDVGLLTSKGHADALRSRMDLKRASHDLVSGVEPKVGSNTSHLSVADENGNVVSLTDSVDCWFGSGIMVPGTGVLLNDEMHDFNPQPGKKNSIGPRKRPASSMAPTILLKDGEPFMALGAEGATKIPTSCVQTIVNVIDFGMDIQGAISAPRFHCESRVVEIENIGLDRTVQRLREKGHIVNEKFGSYNPYSAAVQGVLIDRNSREVSGGADPRRDGVVLGY